MRSILFVLGFCAAIPAAAQAGRDAPEEIARSAMADMTGATFYNKPGATRAQYLADWQQCRVIMRGEGAFAYNFAYDPDAKDTGTGDVPPLGVSAAMIGVGLFNEGKRRDANRRVCLLVRGWREVQATPAHSKRLAGLSGAARSDYLDTILGAEQVEGSVTAMTGFAPYRDPAIDLDAPVSGTPTVLFNRVPAVDPIQLAPGEAAMVMTFRRSLPASSNRIGQLDLARYDVARREMVKSPGDAKKTGDKTVYFKRVESVDRKSPYEVQIVRLTPGDYVIAGTDVGPAMPSGNFCLGAPTFHVGEGETVYIGDFVPLWGATLSTGKRVITLGWTPKIEEARAALATAQPALAAAMKPAVLRNRATYGCFVEDPVNRWDLPGVEDLPPPG